MESKILHTPLHPPVALSAESVPTAWVAKPRVLPYLGCSYRASFMLIRVLATIPDAVVVSHMSAGCDADWVHANRHYRDMLRRQGLPVKDANLVSTNLTEKEIIFGCDEKLIQTVKEVVEKYNPKVVFIRTKCCIPGRTPSEMLELIEHLQQHYKLPILLARCDFISGSPYKRRRRIVGCRKPSWEKIAPANEQIKNRYNLINFSDDENFTQLLTQSGVDFNYLSYGSSFEAYTQSAQSEASIQFSTVEFGMQFGSMLQRKKQIPFYRLQPPFGINNTDHTLRSIGLITNKKDVFDKIIASQKETYMPQIEKLRKKLAGITCLPIIAGYFDEEPFMLSILNDLGLKVPDIEPGHLCFSTLKEHSSLAFSFYGDDGLEFGAYGGYKLLNFIKQQQPDVLIVQHTGVAEWSVRMGIPTIELKEIKGGLDFMGYEGLVRLGNKILSTHTNSSYIKNIARRATFPYTGKWLNRPMVVKL